MFEIRNFYVWIVEDGIEIICGLNFMVKVGEVVVIMGLNGLGKLMLFYILLGCEDYEVIEGDIFYNGESILEFDLVECVVKGIFFVF